MLIRVRYTKIYDANEVILVVISRPYPGPTYTVDPRSTPLVRVFASPSGPLKVYYCRRPYKDAVKCARETVMQQSRIISSFCEDY